MEDPPLLASSCVPLGYEWIKTAAPPRGRATKTVLARRVEKKPDASPLDGVFPLEESLFPSPHASPTETKKTREPKKKKKKTQAPKKRMQKPMRVPKAREVFTDLFDDALDGDDHATQKKQRHNHVERRRVVRLNTLFSELAAELGLGQPSKAVVLQEALRVLRERLALSLFE